ncbi:MAG TPA: sugar transferase [Verrucomicrobiae bacterium]|nr:sugar transferase [Verrucomicrobiae bacterium]
MKSSSVLNGQQDTSPGPSYAVSPWCSSSLKRAFDLVGAVILLIALLPLLIAVGLAVKLTSRGTILFRQNRPGRNGAEFVIAKFRTMTNGGQGPMMTRADDPRVTRLGRHLRKWKLDELPQLLNVLKGEMSFVGPRPLPTSHWTGLAAEKPKECLCVFSVRPGVTSQATVNFRNEEDLLTPSSPEEVEKVYMRAIMPVKLKMDIDYLRKASFASDLRIIFKTVLRVFYRQKHKDLVIPEDSPAAPRGNTRPRSAPPEFLSAMEEKECLPGAEHTD